MNARRFLPALFALIMVVLTIAPAFAIQPVTETFEDTITNSVLASCDGFDIIENATTTLRLTTFFNQAGDPSRVQTRFTYQGTFTNSSTGKSITDAPDPQLYVFDVTTGELTTAGLIISVNVPGEGVVLLDAGKMVFDANGNVTFQSGPHHLYGDQFEFDYKKLCAALQ